MVRQTLSCRTSLKSGTAAAVPAVPAAPPMAMTDLLICIQCKQCTVFLCTVSVRHYIHVVCVSLLL